HNETPGDKMGMDEKNQSLKDNTKVCESLLPANDKILQVKEVILSPATMIPI
ncbi:4604_t:CDS:2, partial [Racocetra persica]